MKTCSRNEGEEEGRGYSGERGVKVLLSCVYDLGGASRRSSTRDWKKAWYQITSLRGALLPFSFQPGWLAVGLASFVSFIFFLVSFAVLYCSGI